MTGSSHINKTRIIPIAIFSFLLDQYPKKEQGNFPISLIPNIPLKNSVEKEHAHIPSNGIQDRFSLRLKVNENVILKYTAANDTKSGAALQLCLPPNIANTHIEHRAKSNKNNLFFIVIVY